MSERWGAEKPNVSSFDGDNWTHSVLESLGVFDSDVKKARVRYNEIFAAKRALEIASVTDDADLLHLEEAVPRTLQIFTQLDETWIPLRKLRDTPWSKADVMKTRRELDAIKTKMDALPHFVRLDDAFIKMRERLVGFEKATLALVSISSESIKDRHWRLVSKHLSLTESRTSISLGRLWDVSDKLTTLTPIVITCCNRLALKSSKRNSMMLWPRLRERWHLKSS